MRGKSDLPQRTDPRSFGVRAVMMLFQLAIPLAIASVTILDDGGVLDFVLYFLPVIIAVLSINLLIAYLQWTRLTYTVGSNDIRVESGLLSRTARSVPYERIQDVSLEQKLVPRLFGLAEVKFETGAGGGDDLALAYLCEAEGERLRELVRERRDGVEVETATVAADAPHAVSPEPAEVLFAMSPQRIVTFGLFEFSLVVVAVVFGALQQFDFLLPFDVWDIEGWERRLTGPGQWLAGLGVLAQLVGLLVALATVLVVGMVTGVVRTVLREWGFLLERTAKGLRRRRGLLTRTDVVMPIHRVQAVRVETGFIRRYFGWHGLKVISLASDSGAANHEAVPFGKMGEIAPVVATTGFRLPPDDAQWHPSTVQYRVDRVLLAIPVFLILSIVAMVMDQPVLAPLPLVLGTGATALYEYLRWRWDRHAIGPRQLYNRHGWFAPSMAIASRVKLQSVEVVQGPLARWRGYASLVLGLAGGSLRIDGMPIAQAREWRAAICDSISGADFSELVEDAAAI